MVVCMFMIVYTVCLCSWSCEGCLTMFLCVRGRGFVRDVTHVCLVYLFVVVCRVIKHVSIGVCVFVVLCGVFKHVFYLCSCVCCRVWGF